MGRRPTKPSKKSLNSLDVKKHPMTLETILLIKKVKIINF